MAVVDTLTSGRLAIVRRPKTALLVLFGVLLAVDLVARLVGFRVFVGEAKVAGGQLGFERLITLAWDGIVVGLAIGLAGIGLSMTYSILQFANFSHGDMITAGSFAGWSVTTLLAGYQAGFLSEHFGYLLTVRYGPAGPTASELGITALGDPLSVLAGVVVAAVATVLLALALDRLVYEPMRDQEGIALLIASIGVALALRYTLVIVYGNSARGLTAGSGEKLILRGQEGHLAFATETELLFKVPLIDIGGYSKQILNVTSHEATLVVISLGLMYGLHLMLQRTKLGKAMRAMADNEDLARVTGIPTQRVVRAAWVIGGGMAGAAGYLIALEQGTLGPNLGWFLLLLIFAAVILGGIGSIYGAMAGGVIIGLTSTVALVWIPSSFATAAAFSIMIVMLLVRPDGLFGGVTTA